MKISSTLRILVLTSAATALLTLSASAVTVLTFEGVGDQQNVGNFYNGGAGGSLGISFTGGLGLVDSDAGGNGNIGGEPSADTVLIFLSGSATTMNVTAGFNTGFSFFYSAPFYTGFVNVYDGLNGTGTLLATLNLGLTPNNGAPDPTGVYSPLVPIGVTFAGTAKSVDFGGTANYIVFDDVTIGSQVAGGGGQNVPDVGTTLSLLGLALGGLGLAKRKLG